METLLVNLLSGTVSKIREDKYIFSQILNYPLCFKHI